MRSKLKRRIRSRSGETITEVLISVLIAALALSLLAGMIFASKRMIETSKAGLQDYIQAENLLENPPATIVSTDPVTKAEGDSVFVTSSVKLTDSGSGSDTAIRVTTYTINDSRPAVVSYKVK